MDETGTLLSVPKSLRVLVGKDNLRNYRTAAIHRETVLSYSEIFTLLAMRYLFQIVDCVAVQDRAMLSNSIATREDRQRGHNHNSAPGELCASVSANILS